MKHGKKLLVLALLLAAVLWLCLLGAAGKRTDVTSSAWLDGYFAKVLPAYAMDFPLSSAFSYRESGGKAVLLYATTATVEDIRAYYISEYAAAEDGRNDDTALALSVPLKEGTARVVNYYSPVSRVVELELTLTAEEAQRLAAPVEEAFPNAELSALIAPTGLATEGSTGSYVRYTYDELSPYYHQNTPIFSRAVGGDAAALDAALAELSSRYAQTAADEAGTTHYVQTEHGVLSLSPVDGERVSVSLQIGKPKR